MTIHKNPIIKCSCGCDIGFLKFDNKKRPRKYIHGHHSKFQSGDLWIRFINKVDPDPFTGCWNFLGSKTRGGYGRMNYKNKSYKAHRLSYEKFIGAIPESYESIHGTCVCHRCDNPSCVNPEHLFIGTQLDNMNDMINKGRNKVFYRKQ